MMWPWHRLRWTIVTAAPGGEAGAHWGDTWFARDLAQALRLLGQRVKVVSRSRGEDPQRDDDDVVLILRGLRRFNPRPGRTVWMNWVISHPDLIEPGELAAYDRVFVASEHWRPAGVTAIPLLQATNPTRFNPDLATPDSGPAVLFVGKTSNRERAIVQDAIAAGVDLSVYGKGWAELIEPSRHLGEYLSGENVGAAYRRAGVVLNDHWPDMAREGFLSNRLFDAVGAGARVLSDDAVGLSDIFGDMVAVHRPGDDFTDSIAAAYELAGDDDRRREHAAWIHAHHSFADRANVLLREALAARKAKRRG